MKLYHGTSIKAIDQILDHGLKPRGKKGKGNWKHTIDSHPDAVYLTNAYAIYFAHTAAELDDDLVVFEIDTGELNLLNLVPDEDFLEQATRKEGPAPTGASMKYRTNWYRRRLRDFQPHWTDSVDGLGTCAYMGEIPRQAIKRYAILPAARRSEIIFGGMDPMIMLLNYKLVGDRYRNWIKWLFGDEMEGEPSLVDHPDVNIRSAFDPGYMRKISRDGITVRTTVCDRCGIWRPYTPEPPVHRCEDCGEIV
jgi:hypothetical protein